MISSYAMTLLVTIVVEVAVAALITHRNRPKDLLLVVLFANLLTHPIASLLIQVPNLMLGFWHTELLVVCAETLLYQHIAGMSFSRALILSSTANLLTIALSFVIV